MRKRPLLVLFFILFTLSCLIKPKKSPIEQYIEQSGRNENCGVVQGVLSSITEKENSLELSIKQASFWKSKSKKYFIKKILVYLKKESIQEELHLGNQVQVVGSIESFQKPTNLGQFNEYDYYKGKKYDCKMFADRIVIKVHRKSKLEEEIRKCKLQWQNICEKQLPKSQAGVIEAMVLGEKSNLDCEIKRLYQTNGIGHIMAISGLHISFLGMGIYKLLKRLGMNETGAVILSVLTIFLYGMMTGFSVSAVRAIIMLATALFARLIGRTYDMLSAMALSGMITVMYSPLQARNSGFLLSYGAIIGIGCCYPILKKTFQSKSKLIDSILVTFSVQIVIIPIVAWFYYEIPLYGFFLNLLVLPVMSLLLASSILGIFSTYIHPAIGRFLFGTVHIILRYYEILCKTVIKLPFSNLVIGKPRKIQLALYCIFIVSILLFLAKKKKRGLFFLLPICFLILSPIPSHQLEVTFLDVGQGDSIFFKSGKTSYLMDGGSSDVKQVGTYRILPFLKAKGIRKLDYMIVSHTDRDHINGLIEILERVEKKEFRVGYLMLPKILNSDHSYKKLEKLAEKANVKVYYIEKGMKWEKEKLKVLCLHPNKNFLVSDKNECSMILSLQYGFFSMLLTGDVEQEGEKEILSHLKTHDVLKIAHHGSKSSSTEKFLEKVNPKIGVISCGFNNAYGHPHKEVIERMKKRKIKLYNTSLNGAIDIISDGKKIKILMNRKKK